MSDKDISKMDFKELRKEVESLRGELAAMKRKYEDALQNIDYDNLSSSFRAEQNNLKTQIKLSEGGINSIVLKKVDLDNAIEIEKIGDATDTSKIYKIVGKTVGNLLDKYYYYNTALKSWVKIDNDTIETMFSQSEDGFTFKGAVVIDGNTAITQNLRLYGLVICPEVRAQVFAVYPEEVEISTDEHSVDNGLILYGFWGGELYEMLHITYDYRDMATAPIVNIGSASNAYIHFTSPVYFDNIITFNDEVNGI
jgi:hypothetical protein